MEPKLKSGSLLDVRVVFDPRLSKIIRKDIEKEHRTAIEQVRFIVDQYYQHKE